MRIPVDCRAFALLVLLALGACDNPVARSAPSADAVAPIATTAVTAPAPGHPIERPTPPPDAGKSCATDADCAVKDAGSCCGVRPVCVHKDTPTFPDQVKAECAKDGRVSTCGFLAITGCQCVAGKCEGVTVSDNGLQVQ